METDLESALQTLMQERALETIKNAGKKNSGGDDADGKGERNSYARLNELFAEYFARDFEDLLTEQDECIAYVYNAPEDTHQEQHQEQQQEQPPNPNMMTSSSATLEGQIEDRSTEKKDDHERIIVKLFRRLIQFLKSIFSSSKTDISVNRDKSCDVQQYENQPGDTSTDISPLQSKQSEKDKKRDLDTISDDIFQEYIKNHMTIPTYQNVIDDFVKSNASVQENLAEEEISAFIQKLMKIATNFGCTKKEFAKETGGYDATGLVSPYVIEAAGNNRTEFSPFT